MKRLILATIILTLTATTWKSASAEGTLSVDLFYNNLGPEGAWVELDDYGYCWQPAVAVSNPRWRPYADGYWAYTDVGWTWVSHEDFGWATYHYGRWVRLHDRGWFWVPGRVWGPAWVSWRTGGDYVGWAPLPPRGGFEAVDDGPINGQVDVEFDIGPAYYNFVDIRYIGEPALRERIYEPSTNVAYISGTVNVTNITYNNSIVYNYGPDYDRLSQYSTRPIRRMTLERNPNADLSTKPNEMTKVQGEKLVVAAPQTLQKPPAQAAPKAVKEKIVKPKVEHGWDTVPDPKAQAELKQKMKSENPKSVPPPSLTPHAKPGPLQSPVAVPSVAPSPRQPVPPQETRPREVTPSGKTNSPPQQTPITPVQKPQPVSPGRVPTPPKSLAPSADEHNAPRPPADRIAPSKLPPNRQAPADNRPSHPLPTVRPAAPGQEPPSNIRQQPRSPERPPAPKQNDVPTKPPTSREPSQDRSPARQLPPSREVPSRREPQPEVHKQQPVERLAPLPEPVRPEPPRQNPPERTKKAPSPAPGT